MSSSPTPAPGYEFELRSSRDTFMIVSVAAVCILIVLVSCYKFQKRFFCCAVGGATFSRTQVQRLHLNEVISQDPSMQLQSHGLESSIIHSLPITQFKKKNGEESRPSNNECAVFNLSLYHDRLVSIHTLPDAPSSEDFFQERAGRYQVLRLEILQNLVP
ncbi:unnamed protein product [Dovyalis caffra]|uniref:Uncharacterized protein n=1 Tax=Dovyalis caffra TaxID=77055 RepID=A0AAV1RA59_9ROSI|nr:unnamed protein product [Dovyalis caffra]